MTSIRNDSQAEYNGSEIAIVGMACRFPGAASVDDFWSNLRDGIESIRFFSEAELRVRGISEELLRDPHYVRANGYLDNIDQFDAGFFGFSPREASIMDPQHRLFLECVWESMEHAGHDPAQFDGSIGVFAGSGMTAYMMYNLVSNPELMHSVGEFLVRHTGNDKDFLTTRASYLFNLRGPSINVQTACSTSLVAVHLASQHLLSGECDMALAGGVTIQIDQEKGYLYQEGEILSPDGHCRAFDTNAEGTVFGSGAGVLVLRRLSDALEDRDTIHAVIRGSAVNNDGSGKVSFLAPSVDGQAQAIVEAIEISDVPPATVTFVEAHGTGTPVGDPIELTALREAYGRGHDRLGYCALGSVKTNIGHLDTAAGAASLIKATLAVRDGQIPPTLHFLEPNPKLEIEKSPFFVNNNLIEWQPECGIRRAGVSSLGVGGTNAHVIIEQPPRPETRPTSDQSFLIPISARTEPALKQAVDRLGAFLSRNPDVRPDDVARTLATGRRAFAFRTAVHGRTSTELVDALATNPASPGSPAADTSTNVFMFAGGGAQHFQMGAGLYEAYAVYRDTIDLCVEHMQSVHKVDLRAVLIPGWRDVDASESLQAPMLALPALFAVEYSLARLFMSIGITPDAMTGHSMGEYVAACLAGVFSLEDGLSLVYTRGRLFETLEPGAMLTIFAGHDRVAPLLGDDVDLAASNASDLLVAAGPVATIENLEKKLRKADVDSQRVRIDVAAHSRMVEPILNEFRSFVSGIQLNEPQLPFVSNVTGTWILDHEATDPEYWVRHLRRPVEFARGLSKLLETSDCVLVEVGPARTLATLAGMHPKSSSATVVTTMRHPKDEVRDVSAFLDAVGKIWSAGSTVNWSDLMDLERAQRIPLPTYSFERNRYWISPGTGALARPVEDAAPPVVKVNKLANVDDWIHQVVWKQANPSGDKVRGRRNWLVLAPTAGTPETSRFLEQIVALVSTPGNAVHLVAFGSDFSVGPRRSTIRPDKREDYSGLMEYLSEAGFAPTDVLHAAPALNSPDRKLAVNANFKALVFLTQAAVESDLTALRVYALTRRGIATTDGEHVLDPYGSLVTGPCTVLPKEIPTFRFQHIDLPDLTQETADRLRVLLDRGPVSPQLAIRDRMFLGPVVEPVATPVIQEVRPFRNGQTYVITGGAGGVGLSLARQLGEKYSARIILIGRTSLPEQTEWESASLDERKPIAIRRRLSALLDVAKAVSLEYVSADVTDEDSLTDAFDRIAEDFGPIAGVLHAAGVLDDGPALAKSDSSMDRVLLPKIAGAENVVRLSEQLGADFVQLFSSTSALLAPAGQVDYASANAFLPALADNRSGGSTHVTAVYWGMWRNRGMTASEDASGLLQFDTALHGHPLFDDVRQTENGVRYSMTLDTSRDWYVNEHRLWTGQALVPGTLIVEMIRAAFQHHTDSRACRMTDLIFAEALPVPDGASVKSGVELVSRADNSFDATVFSYIDGRRHDHAFASITSLTSNSIDQPYPEFETDDVRRVSPTDRSKQEQWLSFGPRWRCLREVQFAAGSASASLELSPQYTAEHSDFGLHPALLDLATGFALPLDDNYESHTDLYVPIAYREIRVYGPLPPRIVSDARLSNDVESHPDFVTLDFRLRDERGTVIVAIDGFAMKRVDARDVARALSHGQLPAESGEQTLLELGARYGIEPSEGLAALERCLAQTVTLSPIVSSVPWERLSALAAQTGTPATTPERSDRDSRTLDRVAPRDDIERDLTQLWSSLLGTDDIGIRDDFFDLGGHSLIAVRLFTKIRRNYGVDLSLATLFRAPTIEKCARLIRTELNLPEPTGPGEPPAASGGEGRDSADDQTGTSRSWTPIVPIHEGGTRKPFFCVHGAGGNVLNFTALSRLLGPDQPFFGLQARGVDGVQPPATSIEEMASDYVAAMLQQEPSGPYIIGGYSGGGVVAYEMAQILTSQGKEVLAVVMLDTFCPSLPKGESGQEESRASRHITALRRDPLRYLGRYAITRFRYERNRLRKAYAGFLTRFGRPLPIELREFKMITAYHAAQDRYQPRPYSGKVILFAAETRGPEFRHVNDDMGWADWARDLEIILSPGDHDTLFREPNVHTMVGHLSNVIDRLSGYAYQGDGASTAVRSTITDR